MTKNKKILALAIFIGVIGVLFLSRNTYAADGANIMKKWVFTQYYSCIRDGYMNDTIKQKNNGLVAKDVFKNSVDMFLPSYDFQHTVKNGSVKCSDLFLGGVDGLSQGVLDYAGGDGKTVDWSKPGAAQKFLEGLGYGLADPTTKDQKFTIVANDHQKYHQVRGFISDDGEKDLEAQSAIIKAKVNNDNTTTYSIEGTYVDFYSTISVEIKNSQLHIWVDTNKFGPYGCSAMYDNQEVFVDLKDNVNQFYSDVKSALQNKTWGKHCYDSQSSGMMVNVDETWDTYTFDVDGSGIIDSASAGDFVYADNKNKYDVSSAAIKDMSGMNIGNLVLSNSELYTLYYYYLDKSIPSGTQNRITCDPNNKTNLTPVNLKDEDGEIKTCYVNFNGISPDSIKVYTQDHTDLRYRQPYPYIKSITMQDVIDWLNLVDPSTLTDIESITPGGSDAADGDTDPCYEAGVEGMSWVLCPALNNMKYTASVLDNMIQDWLSLGPEWYDSGSATFDVWEIMRNVANAALTIVLLVVIFSQLTGYGIDNFGIKKILPRLVAMAIVVNLSFVICEAIVDLSNILGVGLRDMFGAIGESLYANRDTLVGEEFIGNMVKYIFALAGLGGAAAPTVVMAATAATGGSGVMAVIIVVLALIVVLFAILLFFVMLGARMIVIILCVAISPIAFALYILPNTQSLFKKWWKIFEAMLVMFPICGALGGISYMIKAMVQTADNWNLWMMVVALIAPYLCFFMLPILLKGAIGLLAGVGAAFTAMASGIKSGAAKGASAVENTERYKDAQKEVARRNQERRANSVVGRLKDRDPKSLSSRDARRLARSYETLDKLKQEDNAARRIMVEKEFGQSTEDDLRTAWSNAFDGGDTERLDAVTSVMSMRYGTGAANWMAKQLSEKPITGNDEVAKKRQKSMQALQYNMAHDSTLATNMRNKASDAYQMISNGGIVGHDGEGNPTYENLEYYSRNNGISKDVKDWSTQSADTLRRAITSGKLDQDTIKSILSSTDPGVQSGIQSDKDKREALLNGLDGETARAYRERYQEAIGSARSASERQQQAIVETLQEINDNLRRHGNNDGSGETS